MNPLQLIEVAIKLGEDGIKLVQDIQSADKAGAVAAVLDVVPTIADITGKDLSFLTAEALGAAWDVEQSLGRIIVAVEAHFAKAAPTP